MSDTHINSTVALCPPIVYKDDGDRHKPSPSQRQLWSWWLDFWQQVNTQPGRKVALFNGDMAELDTRRRTTQIITANKATIINMVLDCLAPALDVVDQVIIVRGTQAHTGRGAWIEEAIAADLDNSIPCAPQPKRPQYDEHGEQVVIPPISWYHFRGILGGVKFDVAHHAAMGRLPWTEKNAANKIASVIMWRYRVDLDQPAPDVAIRSHNHRRNDSGGNYQVYALATRCWSLATEYAYRIGQENSLADIGGHVFVCEDGEYRHIEMAYKPRKGRIWTAI